MRYRIEVTPEDIEGAGRCTATNCPVARALKRLFPERSSIYVEHEQIEVYRGRPDALTPKLTLKTTQRMERFINRWDHRGIAQPAVFLVEEKGQW